MAHSAPAKIRPKMSKEQRSKLASGRSKLMKRIIEERRRQRQVILEIAGEFDKSAKHIANKTYISTSVRQGLRKKTLFNAVIHDTATKLRENGEAPQGKGALREISKKVASSNWRDVSPEEAKRLLAQLENNSIPKPVSKKNTAKDVGKVYEDVKTMLDGVATRTGCHYMLFMMRDGVTDNYTTRCSTTARVKDACVSLFKSTPETMAMRLESHLTQGIEGTLKETHGAKQSTVLKEVIRGHTLETLRSTLRDKGLTENNLPTMMAWTPQGYEKLVTKWGVELRGWTEPGEICNPGSFKTVRPLQRLWAAMQSDVCRWVCLEQEEWDNRKKEWNRKVLAGEVPSRAPRGSKKSPSSPAIIEDQPNPEGEPPTSVVQQSTTNGPVALSLIPTDTSPIVPTLPSQPWDLNSIVPFINTHQETNTAMSSQLIQGYNGLNEHPFLDPTLSGLSGMQGNGDMGGWCRDFIPGSSTQDPLL